MQLVNGPDGFTPDGHYALGPVPGRVGLWVAAGMSINGVAGAGGVGRVMAEWILGGEPSVDVHELDVRRFGSHLRDRAYVTEKAREVYRHYYALQFPCDEPSWGRPCRTSALYARLLDEGAVFGERNGWERANYFVPGRPGRRQGADERTWGRPSYAGHVADEHRAVRERVGVLDMSSFGKLDVVGPGALALLQRLAANDVDRPPGRVVYTQLLNTRGGIEADVTVIRLSSAAFRVTTGTASTARDLGWIRLHLPGDGSVEVEDVTERYAVISVWGPEARRTLGAISGSDLSTAAFPYLASRAVDVAGVAAHAHRVSFAGELGYELVVDRGDAARVWDAVLAAGRPHGIAPVGYYALNTLRLEKGFCYWGDDIGPDDTPLEAGLDFCVRLDKGPFIGRDALVRQREEGVRRRLVSLVLDREACVVWGGEAVIAGERVVGRVRTGGEGHTVGLTIALAYLPVGLAQPGTRVSVESFGQFVPAEVRMGPLWDPRGVRVRI